MIENQPKFSRGHEQIPENDRAGPGDLIPAYPKWFCLGLFCPLLAAICMGRKMNEKKPFIKYGILGKLIFRCSLCDFP